MSQLYPCPNPVCSHAFTAGDLSTGAAAITCPSCGMVIQLRTAAVHAAPPPPPAAVPLARPVVAAVPPPAPPPVAELAPPIVPARRRGSRDWLTYGLLFGFLIMMGGLLVIMLMVHGRGGFGNLLGGGVRFKSTDLNFVFEPKSSGWERNDGMKGLMGEHVHLVLMRTASPGAYFAIQAQDFKDHTPSPRELDDTARRKLKEMFPAVVESSPGAGEPPAPADPIAAQVAYRITFYGKDSNDKQMYGEVFFFASQGLGYWLYTLAPDEATLKQLAGEFKELRKGLVLLGDRSDWNKTLAQRTVFEGAEVKGYQVTDTTGRWKRDDDPQGHDPQADLVLRAVDPSKPRQATLGADLIVMSLKSEGDPVSQARQHILAKHARDAYPETKISEAGGDAAKDRVGIAPGHLLRWRINNGGGRERFAVVGVVPRSEDLLVLYGECAWDRRFAWELQLQQVIESLELK